MKVQLVCTLIGLSVVEASAANANPATYGQQLCVMMRSGITKDKAWDYIARDHTKAAMANAQMVIPWYSAASAGWALGTALGNAELAQKQLVAMKNPLSPIRVWTFGR